MVGLAACGGDDDDAGVASLDGASVGDDDSNNNDDNYGDDGRGPGSRDVDDSEFQDAALAYAECMRDHGVDMPDPTGDGAIVFESEGPASASGSGSASGMPEGFEEAQEACGPIMEDVAPSMDLSPEEQAEMQDQMVEMAECMRERGHDMPDPQITEDGAAVRIGGGSDDGGPRGGPDEQFGEDMEECSEGAGLGSGGFSASSAGSGEGNEEDDE